MRGIYVMNDLTLDSENIACRLRLVLSWVFESGILGDEGYFFSWYDADSREYPFVYTEMLGYGISTILYFYQKTGDGRYLERALKTGDWLIEHVTSMRGAFQWKYFLNHGIADKVLYAFDNAVCMRALLDLSQLTDEGRFREAAMRSARWLFEIMGEDDGSFRARYDPESRVFGGSRWSHRSGSYHGKIGIGVHKVAEYLPQFEDVSLSLGNWVLSLQDGDGRFITNPGSPDTYVHAHCYAAEGLLYLGLQKSDSSFIDAALTAAAWLKTIQRPNGAVGRWYRDGKGLMDDDNMDALAQSIRLWMLCGTLQGGNDYTESIETGLRCLLGYQSLDDDPRIRGGMHYAKLNGEVVPHINCCVSLFTAQALQMYLEWRSGNISFDFEAKWLV